MALQLRRAGWIHARALIGGWQKWEDEGMPVEPLKAD